MHDDIIEILERFDYNNLLESIIFNYRVDIKTFDIDDFDDFIGFHLENFENY